MKTGLLKTGLSQALFAVAAALAPLPLHADEPVRLETLNTHSRLEIRVDESVSTRLKNTSKGFELILNGVGLSDLGAPLGEEDAWRAQYETLSDSRLSKLHFQEIPGALRITGSWKYRSGPSAPAKPAMECFDYRDKAPARYVLDFWAKGGPTVAEMRARKERLRKKALAKKLVLEEKSYARRSLAMAPSGSASAAADQEGPARFCKQPLSEENDVFLAFRPLHERPEFSRWLSLTRPDTDFPYYRPSASGKGAEDAAYARLALDLNREGKSALVIRTVGFLETEHPQSPYLPEMRLLKASSLVKLGLEQEAEGILKSLTLSAKETPVALQAGLFLAGKSYVRGEYLPAFENFMYLIQHDGDHRLAWVFHLGAAETLYELKQFDRAEKEYEWVMEHAPGKARAEGGLRKGDLPLSRLQYDQALGTYFEGLHYFPQEASSFPAIHVNRAETLYWLGQHERAEKEFKAFLAKFPDHPEGWRATFRLGEISGRRDSKEAQAESRKWFYETINRFPFSPGATLARLRLIPCGDHAGMDSETQGRFFSGEAASFDGKGAIVMRDYVDFLSLAHVRALITSDHDGHTVADAFQDLQATKNPRVKNLIGSVIGGYFRKSILAMVSAGQGYQALSFYHDKAKLVPDQRGVNPDYLLKLSQTASDLGFGKLAGELASRYESENAARGAGDLRAPAKEPESPSLLRTSEESFTMAKALWTSSGAKEGSKIRELLSKVIEESQYSYQREIILGLLDEKENRPASALAHVMKAELLAGEKDFRLEAWLASLQSRAGESSVALELFRELEKHEALPHAAEHATDVSVSAKLGVPPVPSREALILAQGGILEKQARWGEAAAAYSRAVEGGLGGNQAMFQYARSMMKAGTRSDREKAMSMLQRLAESKSDDFWRKLALEALADEKSKQMTQAAKEGGR